MCNSLNAARSAVPIVDFYPTLSAGIDSPPIRIHGSINSDDGLRASVSASDGLTLHLDGSARHCLSPQAAPDNLIDDDNLASWPLPRRDGETASQGLVRLLRTAPHVIESAGSARFLCTLFLWAQEMAYEFDLRGGVVLHLDRDLHPMLDDAECRDAVLRFASTVKQRVKIQLQPVASLTGSDRAVC